MTEYKKLFEPIQVGSITLKNRFIMPPMANNLANADGTLSPNSIAYYTERARGGVGLIITECSAIDFPHGLIVERQPKVNSNSVMPDWRRLAESVHSYDTKIIAQIHHGGFLSDPDYNNGELCISPSGYDGDLWFKAREMSHDEVNEIIEKHIFAAEMLYKAGLDGVEVHASSTYLINEFLTLEYNHRTDEYGGALENRARILTEIISGIKKRCPGNFMISVRLAIKDLEISNGLSIEEGVEVARLCETAGADMINATMGFFKSQCMDTESQWQDEGGRLYMATPVKEAMTTAKVAAVGKFRSPSFCNEVIEQEKTDLICIGRQLLCDPFWVRKLECGQEEQIRPCLNCNDGCINQLFRHGNLRCAINPYTGYEHQYSEHNVPAAGIRKKVMIVGGGIAGMQTAIIAAKRGHDVTITERTDKLGGQMILAGKAPHKEVIQKALHWYQQEIERLCIKVKLNAETDAKMLNSIAVDAIVIATGARPVKLPIMGKEKVATAWDILGGNEEMLSQGKTAVIIGGGMVGCETALFLHKKGYKITILEKSNVICTDEEPMHREFLEAYLRENIRIETGVMVTEIADSEVMFETAEGKEAVVRADLIISAVGSRPYGREIIDNLDAAGILVYLIGDSVKVGNLRSATRSAMDVAYLI
ncbi:FAD-dependent oxidoreductase [Clostridium sp. WB02_MRS01]|uniref:NAD(P)/FAD-dependent oxidoreductase n=1 Tax=Clostridium sp. WB02_MRS01 TaxID=2605777 RepID=UPI0012B3AB7F|nr:NAD(P)/FAD-dependent oxidoreductase [Clostridium sp. WB02_MRS01]MSS08220.1 FAD-dependent oxidoreductase [Clostridium sp. WB02_MRS01]